LLTQDKGEEHMIEVLKQMTEALEDFVDVIKYDNEQDDIGRRACCDVLSYNPHREDCKAIKSIASLRQAIAELESQEPIYQYQLASGAWIDQTKESHDYNVRHGQATVRVLNTHPPQRIWVGLTDEDCRGMSAGDRLVAMWADRTLKEKNT
jgi:hypothetical protein